MRRRAIRELEQISMPLARKINAAQSCHVQEWLLPALCAYTKQAKPITVEDVDLLGWDYVLRIIRAREENPYHPYVGVQYRTPDRIRPGVVYSFQGELKRMAEQEKGLSST